MIHIDFLRNQVQGAKNMMRNVLAMAMFSFFGVGLFFPSTGFAGTTPGGGSPTGSGSSQVCEAIGSGSDCDKNAHGSADVNVIVELVINVLSTIVGVAAVIMIIISGFKYVTAGGDSNKVSSAKSTLIYALIGLVIVALAQVMVRYVLAKVTK